MMQVGETQWFWKIPRVEACLGRIVSIHGEQILIRIEDAKYSEQIGKFDLVYRESAITDEDLKRHRADALRAMIADSLRKLPLAALEQMAAISKVEDEA